MKLLKSFTSVLLISLISISAFAFGELKREPRFPTTQINQKYIGEDTSGHPVPKSKGVDRIIYLSAEERESFRVIIKDGVFYRQDGTVFQMKESMVNYVLDSAGNIYFFENQVRKELRHSSILAGQPVSAAGEATLDANGRLLTINRHSGHYTPRQEFLEAMIQELKNDGADLSRTAIDNSNKN